MTKKDIEVEQLIIITINENTHELTRDEAVELSKKIISELKNKIEAPIESALEQLCRDKERLEAENNKLQNKYIEMTDKYSDVVDKYIKLNNEKKDKVCRNK